MPRPKGSPNKPIETDNTQHLKVLPKQINEIDCADCGCTHARVVTHAYIHQPYPHWRHKCNCGRILNPLTNQWEHITIPELNKLIREERKKVPAE